MSSSRIRERHLPVLLAALLLGATGTADGASYPVYSSPPSAEQLAQHLFPARYRNSAAAPGAGGPADSGHGGLFGMLVQFEFDSSRIHPDSATLLDAVGELLTLERVRHRAIVIEGHADAIGGERYNLALSERRADAVRRYLVDRFGVSAKRLVTVGKGESTPYDAAAPADPRNRRVVFRPLRKLVLK